MAQSTDAVRGKIGFGSGRHAWEVVWDGPLGTVAVLGVTTKDAPVQVLLFFFSLYNATGTLE